MIRKPKICPYCNEVYKQYTSVQPNVCAKSECIKKFNSEKEVKKRITEMKKERIDYREILQSQVQTLARMVDNGLPCLATGRTGQIHGGHVYARGGNSSMALNLHNIHRQCAQSNHFQNDDGLMKEGLLNEYGQAYADFVSELRRTPQLRYNNAEYEQFCKVARKLIKEFEYPENSPKARIEKRNYINEVLGIYGIELSRFNN